MDKLLKNIPSQSEINNDVTKNLRELQNEIPHDKQETIALLNQIKPNILAKMPVGKIFIRDKIVKIINAYKDKVYTNEQRLIISKLDDVRNALNEAIEKTVFTRLKNALSRLTARRRINSKSKSTKKRNSKSKSTKKRNGGQNTPRQNSLALQLPDDDENRDLPVAEGVQRIPMAELPKKIPLMETLRDENALTKSEKMRYKETHPPKRFTLPPTQEIIDRIEKIPCTASRPDLCVLKLILSLTLHLVFIPLGFILNMSAFVSGAVVGIGLRVAFPFLLPIRLLILVLMRLFNLSTTEYFAFDRAFATPDSMMQAYASRPGEAAEEISTLPTLYPAQGRSIDAFSDNVNGYRQVTLGVGPKDLPQERFFIKDNGEYEVPTAEVLNVGIPAPGGGKMRKLSRKQKSKSKKYRSRKLKKQN
jgi:hypothetical protein